MKVASCTSDLEMGQRDEMLRRFAKNILMCLQFYLQLYTYVSCIGVLHMHIAGNSLLPFFFNQFHTSAVLCMHTNGERAGLDLILICLRFKCYLYEKKFY